MNRIQRIIKVKEEEGGLWQDCSNNKERMKSSCVVRVCTLYRERMIKVGYG